LDLAAFHDIGQAEPSTKAEWFFLIFSLPLWFFLAKTFRKGSNEKAD
jgi:hypothetical protein